MKRSFNSKLLILTGILVSVVATATPATAQSSTIIYDVKFSDVFPEKAAKYREFIRRSREKLEDDIRREQTAEQRQQMIYRGRELMRELTWQIALECPPTTLVIHNSSPGDVDEAIRQLRSGALRVGGTVHVREKNRGGAVQSQPATAATGGKSPGFGPGQASGGRGSAVNRVRSTNTPTSKSPPPVKRQSPQRQPQPNTPNFDGLNDVGRVTTFQPGGGHWGVE